MSSSVDTLGPTSSIERSLSILVTIGDRGEVSAATLASELGIPLSTVYRYLRTLREYGLVDEDGAVYTVGWRSIGMSGPNLTNSILSGISADVLRSMVESLSETAIITVRSGTRAVCLRQARSSWRDPHVFKINQLLPLHASAGQRVLLAFAPPRIINAVVSQDLRRFTENTPDREELLRQCDEIRRTGYAVSHGELQVGALTVAVPVFLAGEVVCSLTVAGAESRCDQGWIERALRVLRRSAGELSRRIQSAAEPGV